MKYNMAKTFKYNPETKEETTRVKRFGNSRKKQAILAVKERRKQRREAEELYANIFNGERNGME